MGAERLTGFDCSVCGQHHTVLPLSYSVRYPLAASAVPSDELERRVVMTADQCVIDDRFYYMRGRFAIPIHGLDEPFIWGCWARLTSADFFRANQLWNVPSRMQDPPYEALLNSDLPLFGDTRNLPIHVHTMPVGRRPHFTPANPNHPIAREQRDGVTMQRVITIAEHMLHPA